MNTEMLMQYITYALGGIGILAFLVSVVVQVIKEMPVLKKIQTNVVALGVALILTPTAVIVLCVYYKIVIECDLCRTEVTSKIINIVLY